MKFLDVGGGNPDENSPYGIGFFPTPDGEDGWVSINNSRKARPTFLGSVHNMDMFEDGTFKHVRALHFPSTQLNVAALEEMSRVLAPGGSILIRTGATILGNKSFATDFIRIFRNTLITGYSDYFGLKAY